MKNVDRLHEPVKRVTRASLNVLDIRPYERLCQTQYALDADRIGRRARLVFVVANTSEVITVAVIVNVTAAAPGEVTVTV